jgi:hypothetical protein
VVPAKSSLSMAEGRNHLGSANLMKLQQRYVTTLIALTSIELEKLEQMY